MTLDRAEYLAGYAAGTGAAPLRGYSTMHEPHYARGVEAGRCATWCGVDLSDEAKYQHVGNMSTMSFTLYGSRGQYLNTVYAVPYFYGN